MNLEGQMDLLEQDGHVTIENAVPEAEVRTGGQYSGTIDAYPSIFQTGPRR